MKRILTLLACIGLAISLNACGDACQDACDKIEDDCGLALSSDVSCDCDDDRDECLADCYSDASCEGISGTDQAATVSLVSCLSGC